MVAMPQRWSPRATALVRLVCLPTTFLVSSVTQSGLVTWQVESARDLSAVCSSSMNGAAG